MSGVETFLILYGRPAILIVELIKAIGTPLPIPVDVIILTVSMRVAAGRFVLWQVFGVLLLALVVGADARAGGTDQWWATLQFDPFYTPCMNYSANNYRKRQRIRSLLDQAVGAAG